MSRYILQDLVRVREHRENKASEAVTLARRVVLEAEKNLAERKKEHADYIEWRIKEEERLIQSIMRKAVKIGDITDLRLEIAALHEREMALLDQVHKAEGEVDRAKEALEQARLAYKKALTELEKLIEHRTLWRREQDLEAERLAELEMEDFQGPKKGSQLNPEGTPYELN
jgi:type III secretion protein O